MRSISQGLGFEKLITLAEALPVAEVPEPKTLKETPIIERVDPEELEYAYVKHPIIFNSINKSTQSIMSAGWEIRANDPKVLDFFKKFVEDVGKVGEKVTFDEILESLFQYQMIYGRAFLETVLGKNTPDPNNIVDLVILDPKRMDYAKKSADKIALGKYEEPIGYTQTIPYDIDTTGLGDPIPEGSEISLLANQIFLLPKRITQFKLYTFGDRFYAQGLVEPAYKSIIYEMMIKKSHANSIRQRGSAPFVDYVGDTFHEPTPGQITGAVENLKRLKSNMYLAFPYWHNIKPLESRPNPLIPETLQYLREDIGASLGMPMAFATGSGEKTNRATLATQHLFLTFTLNDIVKRTISTLRKSVFRRICKYQKFKEVPEIVWGHIGVEEINEKADRITKYVKEGILSPEDVREFALRSERLKKFD